MGKYIWGPLGQTIWVRHGQTKTVPYRLPTWAQGSTHIGNLYMGYEWEKHIGHTLINHMGQTWANTIGPIWLPTWTQGSTHIGYLSTDYEWGNKC